MSIRPDDWPRARAVFEHALALPDSARRRYLADACVGRDELRQHVERLLESHGKADAFLETPLAPMLDDTIAVRSLEGQRIGPYLLSVRVGSGGMGEVYKARDTRLDRTVAIKVLPSHVANDQQARERFDREGRAIAGLNHPHICVLHDVGEATVSSPDSGVPSAQPALTVQYLVMELLEGETLAARLARGPIPLDEALRYATQIASALDKAHSAGIVHRDLKPGNVFLVPRSGASPAADTKLLDFGLAKQHSGWADGARELTTPGMILGTMQYMAPEQIEGKDTDARTDIFAFGAVLFEMLTGRKAFEADSHAALMVAILDREPTRLTALQPLVPSWLDAVVGRCLAKDPRQRWTSARDLMLALQAPPASATDQAATARVSARRAGWIAGGAVVSALGIAGLWQATRTGTTGVARDSQLASIAVLPFHSLAPRDDLKFLEVGIPDAIINKLSRASQVRVRPTDAILRFEGQTVSPRDAAKTLAAEYVLTGTLQPTGALLRVSVQLVRAADETSLWGDHYDIDRKDLLTLQDRIASEVAAALPIRMSTADRDRVARPQARNTEAFELYLRGRAALVRYTAQSTREAIASFEKALQIDPRDPHAHAGLASAAAVMRIRFAPESELQDWLDRGQREAAAALALDPNLAEVHEARAAVARYLEFDWDLAINESDRALALNPSLENPHFYRAAAFYHFGLFDRARTEIRLGMENNPVNRVEPLRLLGTTQLLAGQFADAESTLRGAQGLSHQDVTSTYLAQALYNQGKETDAEQMLAALTGSNSAQARRRAQATLASYLGAKNERVKARALIADVLAGSYMDHHVAYSLGVAFAQIGDLGEARRWLTRAAAEGFPCYPWYANDPLMQSLKSDPAFQEFMKQLSNRFDASRARFGG
jgi:eukaryotic-like serine/threonine-protein kinase